jgi:hypothetical protein
MKAWPKETGSEGSKAMKLVNWLPAGAALVSTAGLCQQPSPAQPNPAQPQAVHPAPAQQPQQQKFPLKSGEWEVSLPIGGPKEKPAVLRVCLNDELWTKALTQNASCSLQQLRVTSKGIQYEMDCSTADAQMKGSVDMIFDGKEHMVARGTTEVTKGGQTAHGTQSIDYRWKGPDCHPDDINIKNAKSQ